MRVKYDRYFTSLGIQIREIAHDRLFQRRLSQGCPSFQIP